MKSYTVTEQPMLSSAARTTDGQSSGYRVDCFIEGVILVNVTAASGTLPTLTITPQISFDNSTYFPKNDDSLEITDTGQFQLPVINFGKYLRIDYEFGGVDTSFTFSVKFNGKG